MSRAQREAFVKQRLDQIALALKETVDYLNNFKKDDDIAINGQAFYSGKVPFSRLADEDVAHHNAVLQTLTQMQKDTITIASNPAGVHNLKREKRIVLATACCILLLVAAFTFFFLRSVLHLAGHH